MFEDTALLRAFPVIQPPSAECLMEGAPSSVVEAELRRLLEDWDSGLEILGDIFDKSLALSDNERGKRSSKCELGWEETDMGGTCL